MACEKWSYSKLSAAKNIIVSSIIGRIVLILELDEVGKGCKMLKKVRF